MREPSILKLALACVRSGAAASDKVVSCLLLLAELAVGVVATGASAVAGASGAGCMKRGKGVATTVCVADWRTRPRQMSAMPPLAAAPHSLQQYTPRNVCEQASD
jgi:hypothetical protein